MGGEGKAVLGYLGPLLAAAAFLFPAALALHFVLRTLLPFSIESGIELLILGGGVVLGTRWSGAGLIALVAAAPLLNGLMRTGLLELQHPVSLAFAGVVLGLIVARARQFFYQSGPAVLVTDACIFLVGVSLVGTLWRGGATWQDAFGPTHWSQLGFGFHAAFVLVQGLFTFRLLIVDPRVGNRAVVTSVFTAHLLTLVAFIVLQITTKMPELYFTHLGGLSGYAWIPNSPADDIHTLGSWGVVGFAFFLSRARRSLFNTAAAVVAFLIVIASWSRIAWLAAGLVIAIWLVRRGWWRMVGGAAVGLLVVVVLAGMFSAEWQRSVHGHFARRFLGLVDVAHWGTQNSDRFSLYRKSAEMVAHHPVAGVGVGQFYRVSAQYGKGDPATEGTNYFAHNAPLQLIAETGFPLGLTVVGLWALAVWRGRLSGVGEEGPWLALVGFSVTQLTANAVNIFDSQALVFGWLVAVVWANRER